MKRRFSQIFSLLPDSIRGYLHFFISPMILLVRGRGIGVVYQIGLMTLTCTVLYQLDLYIDICMGWLRVQPSFPNRIVPYFQGALSIITFSCVLPAFIVGCFLPLRLQSLSQGKIPTLSLLIQTPQTFVRCARCLLYLLSSQYRQFVPILVLLFCFHSSGSTAELVPMQYYCLVGICVLLFTLFNKLLSFLLSPPIAILGRYQVEYALEQASHLVVDSYFEVLFVVGVTALLLLGSIPLSTEVAAFGQHPHLFLLISALVVFWYSGMLLGIICLKRIHFLRN